MPPSCSCCIYLIQIVASGQGTIEYLTLKSPILNVCLVSYLITRKLSGQPESLGGLKLLSLLHIIQLRLFLMLQNPLNSSCSFIFSIIASASSVESAKFQYLPSFDICSLVSSNPSSQAFLTFQSLLSRPTSLQASFENQGTEY